MTSEPFAQTGGEPGNARLCYVGGDDVRMRIPLLQRLRAGGFWVAACGTEDARPFDAAGIPYYRYRLSRSVNPLADYRSVADLTGIFRALSPDLVHAFDTKPNFVAAIAARRARIARMVNTVTGMGRLFAPGSSRLLRLAYIGAYRYLDRLADVSVFQNEDDLAFFRRHAMVGEGSARLIRGSGVDVEALQASVPSAERVARLKSDLGLTDRIVVAMVSRVIREKGVIEFLKAAEIAGRRQPKLRFILVGPRETEGKQAIDAVTIDGYAQYVDYLGPRNDIPALLSLTDILVLPTMYREGIPRVLLEGGALGVALVASDAPGCRDVARHRLTGLIVPQGSIGPLAEAIVELAAQPELRRQMGQRAQTLVREEFSLDKVTSEYAATYRDLLSGR